MTDRLAFISDENLRGAVKFLLDVAVAAKKKSEEDFEKNVIDPFGCLFEIAGFNTTTDTWLHNEQNRQAQKTLQNSVGAFHQQIIGSLRGWENAGTGGIVDAVNHTQKIVAEIKNKYNTVKGDHQKLVYDTLHDAVMPKQTLYHGYCAYYVEIIPPKAKRYNVEYTPSDNKTGQKRSGSPLIRKIDGYSFYELATGEKDALEKLYKVLPDMIEGCLPGRKIPQDDRTFTQGFFNKAYKG